MGLHIPDRVVDIVAVAGGVDHMADIVQGIAVVVGRDILVYPAAVEEASCRTLLLAFVVAACHIHLEDPVAAVEVFAVAIPADLIGVADAVGVAAFVAILEKDPAEQKAAEPCY